MPIPAVPFKEGFKLGNPFRGLPLSSTNRIVSMSNLARTIQTATITSALGLADLLITRPSYSMGYLPALAKLLPGHIVFPPPNGKYLPLVPVILNFTASGLSDDVSGTRNLSALQVSTSSQLLSSR